MDGGETLERRAAMGDAGAFAALMTSTKAGLHRFIRGYIGDEHEAHDLAQETYASAWFSIRRYDSSRPFDTWLRSIAVNKCRDWGRRRAVRRLVRGVVGLDAPEARKVGEDRPEPESRLDDQRRVGAVERALVDLPDALKAPLLLMALEGRSQVEIAGILGISAKAVETRIARARRKLAKSILSGAA